MQCRLGLREEWVWTLILAHIEFNLLQQEYSASNSSPWLPCSEAAASIEQD